MSTSVIHARTPSGDHCIMLPGKQLLGYTVWQAKAVLPSYQEANPSPPFPRPWSRQGWGGNFNEWPIPLLGESLNQDEVRLVVKGALHNTLPLPPFKLNQPFLIRYNNTLP